MTRDRHSAFPGILVLGSALSPVCGQIPPGLRLDPEPRYPFTLGKLQGAEDVEVGGIDKAAQSVSMGP